MILLLSYEVFELSYNQQEIFILFNELSDMSIYASIICLRFSHSLFKFQLTQNDIKKVQFTVIR